MDKICKVEGCNNTGQPDSRTGVVYLKRGWCHKHYERWRRNGDPTKEMPRRGGRPKRDPDETERECKTCKVVKPIDEYHVSPGNGFRHVHCDDCRRANRMAKYYEERRNKPKTVRYVAPVDHGTCTFEGCDDPAHAQLKGGPAGWFCRGHYQQHHAGKPLRPKRLNRKSYIDGKVRICTHCDEIKPEGMFGYRAKSDNRQSQCRECFVKVSRVNSLLREGRHEEALRVAETMAERPRKKYVDRVANAIKEAENG